MNIVGIWNNQNTPGKHETSWPFGTLELEISNNVTIIEKKSVKLIYEGTIFDRTSEELINGQTAILLHPHIVQMSQGATGQNLRRSHRGRLLQRCF